MIAHRGPTTYQGRQSKFISFGGTTEGTGRCTEDARAPREGSEEGAPSPVRGFVGYAPRLFLEFFYAKLYILVPFVVVCLFLFFLEGGGRG